MTGPEILASILKGYGLDSADVLKVLDDAIKDDPTQFDGVYGKDLILKAVRGTETYKTRFKANEYLAAAGKPLKSEQEIIDQEDAYRLTLAANGMPKGFYDSQDDFAKFIAGTVSPAELNTRIVSGYNAVMQAEPGTKAELKQLYGLSDGDIAAFFIDPTRFKESEATKKATAAMVASEARRQAGISLTAAGAEALVTEGAGRAEAQKGFATIAAEQELYNPLQGEQAITQAEQIAGTFGTNAEARKAIATRKATRKAAFETGGGFATTQGASALGTVGQ